MRRRRRQRQMQQQSEIRLEPINNLTQLLVCFVFWVQLICSCFCPTGGHRSRGPSGAPRAHGRRRKELHESIDVCLLSQLSVHVAALVSGTTRTHWIPRNCRRQRRPSRSKLGTGAGPVQQVQFTCSLSNRVLLALMASQDPRDHLELR